MTAGLPVGRAAWLRVPVSFFLTILLLACGGEVSAATFKNSGRLSVSIRSPVTGGAFSTATATLALAGNARDTVAITRVTWRNDRGGRGLANGTVTWAVPNIQMAPGINKIVVTAHDVRGNWRNAGLTVNYQPPATPATPATPAAADTQAPTAPGGMGVSATSISQINLSWTAATDSVGVTGYRIERCQGAGCASFAQIATVTGTTFNNTGLTGATSYSYRVRATDAVGNLSGYSAPASAATLAANHPPVISGSASTTVVAGSAYVFTPTASDPDGQTLTFSVMGAPAWATFNSATGTLGGTPGVGDVGLAEGIVITVSDGTGYASLPAFSLAVVQAASGTAMVSWLPPLQRTDGSALTNLAGYHIRFGTSAVALNQTIQVSNPGLTSYMVGGLTSGAWYFSVSAFDSAGVESDMSNIGSKTIL